SPWPEAGLRCSSRSRTTVTTRSRRPCCSEARRMTSPTPASVGASAWTFSGLAFGLVLLVQGCAGLIPGKGSATADSSGRDGGFQVRKGRPGVVIGAPPGVSDAETEAVVRDLASLTGFGLVVVRGSADRHTSALVGVEANDEEAPSAYR